MYQMTNRENSYGLQFSEFAIARGKFNMIEHQLFNSNADWSRMAVAVDLSTFKIAYLNGRKTRREEFNLSNQVVDNGIDAVGGTLTTELTCVVKNPPANAVIHGLTAAAAG
jgi:3-isopropylmalate dehydratase small subunit